MKKKLPKDLNDAMWEFFMRTSIPRLLKEKLEAEKELAKK